MFHRKTATATAPETTAELIVTEAISTIEAASEAAIEVPAAAIEPTETTTAKKKTRKEKKATATEITATDTTAPTLADIADLPNFAVPGDTSAPAAKKAATPKTPAAPSDRQKVAFDLMLREEGATIRELIDAGVKGSAISSLRSAEKNGYTTEIKNVDGKNHYLARRA
jgi:hypothetical protein